jgi:hypothetical protein
MKPQFVLPAILGVPYGLDEINQGSRSEEKESGYHVGCHGMND